MEQDIDSLIRAQQLQSTYHESELEQNFRKELYGPPPKLLVRFYVGAQKYEDDNGVSGYREKIYVVVQIAGERDSITQEVTEEHLEKYPREWELFLRLSKKQTIPLAALPKMRPAIKAAFNDLQIYTIDDVLTKEIPSHLLKWRDWAVQIKAIHDSAEGVEAVPKKKRGRPPKVVA